MAMTKRRIEQTAVAAVPAAMRRAASASRTDRSVVRLNHMRPAPRGGKRGPHPGQQADADPARRQRLARKHLAQDDERVEPDGEMEAVEEGDARIERHRHQRRERQPRIELQHEHGDEGCAQCPTQRGVRQHAEVAHEPILPFDVELPVAASGVPREPARECRTASHPALEAAATVGILQLCQWTSTPRSSTTRGCRRTTTCVALAAPEIARLTAPGQFVMVKPGTRHDPLLRRPFSVFEILRDRERRPIGVSLLNKRVGIGTHLLYELRRGDRLPCLGPLGRPFRPVAAAGRGVDGGRRRRARAVRDPGGSARQAGHADDALLRRPHRQRSSPHRAVRGARRASSPSPPKTARAATAASSRCRSSGRCANADPTCPVHALRLRSDADDARGGVARPNDSVAAATCRSSSRWDAAWAAATAASSPSGTTAVRRTSCDRASTGPGLRCAAHDRLGRVCRCTSGGQISGESGP